MVVSGQGAIDLSQRLLEAARYNDPADSLVEVLEHYDQQVLANELDTEARQKTFWLNMYNAAVQLSLKRDSAQYKKYMSFFNTDAITIAGVALSPNDIEHGIIRGGQWIYGLGYLSSWFPGDFKKKFALETLDPRIHFALNCAAESCPPILFYTEERIDEQLDLATLGFLRQTVRLEDDAVYVSKIFSWYRGDFGGKMGILRFISARGLLDKDPRDYKLKFSDYDWSLRLNQYADL